MASRVLKKGGLLISIDGDMVLPSSMMGYSHFTTASCLIILSQRYFKQNAELIQRSLSISSEVRPQWDVNIY